MPAQRRHPQQQFGFGFFLDRFRQGHAEKGFGIAGPAWQFDVQLDFPGQCQHLRALERIARQQRRAFLALLDVFEDHAGFIDEALLYLQHRDLSARADGQCLGAGASIKRYFFERQSFFQQRQFDHVVVVTDGESIKLDHHKASRPCGVGSACL
ncbi:hypothetical protein D3C86_1270870 [compost metagenome]